MKLKNNRERQCYARLRQKQRQKNEVILSDRRRLWISAAVLMPMSSHGSSAPDRSVISCVNSSANAASGRRPLAGMPLEEFQPYHDWHPSGGAGAASRFFSVGVRQDFNRFSLHDDNYNEARGSLMNNKFNS
jgi:hypothetical protein